MRDRYEWPNNAGLNYRLRFSTQCHAFVAKKKKSEINIYTNRGIIKTYRIRVLLVVFADVEPLVRDIGGVIARRCRR